ncbi:MAG TPA: phosphotransferase [Pseudomonadales bacterium]
MQRLPHLPDGLTADFLTDLLHGEGILPASSCVARVECEQIADGTGMMAELARLTLRYEGDPGAAPPTFIAKYSSRNETNRAIALQYNLPERETRFMSAVAPRSSVRTPRVYYCGLDDDRFLILMEDLSAYRVGSQVEGATLEQSELAIDELAKLHAQFWNRAAELDWLPGISNSYHADNMKTLAGVGFDGLIAKFGAFVPTPLSGYRDTFLAAIDVLQQRMDTAPVTLCHGDFRMENLLFGCRPGHHPIVVLDWQGPIRGRGMNDVALFLGQSTRTEVRREHERALLGRYVDGLEAGGVKGLDRDAVWDDYRQALLYNWLYVSVVAGTLDTSHEKSYAWMAQMVARQAAVSEDLDVFALLR